MKRIVLLLLTVLAIGGCATTDDNTAVDVATLTQHAEVQRVRLSGAIFTTTVDGSYVNANHYEFKEDVFLDGGPGLNAPVTAAGLPEGYYYFQVTDPSGKDLLSSDHISCRKVHVNALGVIDSSEPGQDYKKKRGRLKAVTCQHITGIDQDHAAQGAITVQLFPYDDTPNRGGVYKVWLTPVDSYDGNPDVPGNGEN